MYFNKKNPISALSYSGNDKEINKKRTVKRRNPFFLISKFQEDESYTRGYAHYVDNHKRRA